jgi:hypothetical protein
LFSSFAGRRARDRNRYLRIVFGPPDEPIQPGNN